VGQETGEINGYNHVTQLGRVDAKSIIAIIDFIILAVNLVNPAIASLYFHP